MGLAACDVGRCRAAVSWHTPLKQGAHLPFLESARARLGLSNPPVLIAMEAGGAPSLWTIRPNTAKGIKAARAEESIPLGLGGCSGFQGGPEDHSAPWGSPPRRCELEASGAGVGTKRECGFRVAVQGREGVAGGGQGHAASTFKGGSGSMGWGRRRRSSKGVHDCLA